MPRSTISHSTKKSKKARSRPTAQPMNRNTASVRIVMGGGSRPSASNAMAPAILSHVQPMPYPWASLTPQKVPELPAQSEARLGINEGIAPRLPVELPVIGTNLGHQVMLHPPPAKRLYEDETQRLAGRLDAPPTVVNDHDPVVLGDTIGKVGTNVERMANELSQARAGFHHVPPTTHLDSSSASPAFLGSYATEILTGSHGDVVIPQEQTAILKGDMKMGTQVRKRYIPQVAKSRSSTETQTNPMLYTEHQTMTEPELSSHQIAGQKGAITRQVNKTMNLAKYKEMLVKSRHPAEEPELPVPIQPHRRGGVVRRAFHL